MATKNICTYPMEPALAKNANAIIEQDGKLKRVNMDWEFDKKANAIVSESDGAVIAVNDSSMARPKNIILCGKSTQKTTKGVNLLKNTAESGSVYGVTFNVNADGTVDVSGTATQAAYLTLDGGYANEKYPIPDWLVSGERYTITDASLFLYSEEGAQTSFTNMGFVMPEGYAYYGIFVRVSSGATMEKTVCPMLIKGSEVLAYEPYTGGMPSPSPDYPQEIVSVENPEIYVYGKNLLKNIAKTSTSNGITFTVNDDGSVTVNGTATAGAWLNLTGKLLLPAGTYMLSGCPKGGVYASTYVLSCDYVADYGNNPKTFTLDKPASITVNIGIYSGYTANNLKFYPMIRCIECEDTTFEQFKEKQTIPLSHTLHGIPVKSGGNYTDADGQEWICDEIDLERGVLVQRVKELVLNGSENWLISSGTYLYLDLKEHAIKGGEGFCSHFDFWYNYGGDCIFASEKWLYLGKVVSDRYGLNVAAWKEFLASNNMTVCYVLAEPIETPLTDAEIYAFKHTEMNYPNTTIINDAGAYMKLDYFADTLKYVLKHGGGGGFSTVSKFEVTLPASGWQKSSDNTYYSQVITVPGATEDSKIDLQPTPAQLISLLNNGTSMFASNEAGTITVYVVGSKPTSDMTMQATKMEVVYV